MTKILYAVFLGALALQAQQVTISDNLPNAVGGGDWTGRITVTLNSPGRASYGSVALSGWQYVVCVGTTGSDCSTTTVAGVVTLPLYATTTLTPTGLSYAARYQPTKGAARTETWVVEPSDATLAGIITSTVPTPTTTFQTSQLLQGTATSGQCLAWSGTAWAPAACGGSGTVTSVAATVPSILSVTGSPITTSGTLALSLATQTANQVFAGPTSGGAATPTFRALASADIPANAANTSGNAATATALATTYASSAILFGAASGTPAADGSNFCFDNSTDRLGLGTCSPGSKFEISNTASIKGLQIVNSSSASAVAALNLYSNLVHTGTGGNALASFTLDHASSIGTALHVQNDGTGYAARILGAGGLEVSDGATCAQSTWLVHLCQGANQTSLTMDAYGSENVILARTALGTSDVPLALSANQMMLNVAARGYTGSAFTTLSRVGMQYYASEAWTASAQGTFINWYVTTHGASASTSKMTLHNDGALVLGLTGSAPLALSGSGAKLQVTGLSEFIGQAQITDADLPYLRWYRNGTIKGYFAIGNGSSIAASAAAGDMVIRAEQTLRLRAGGDAGGASLDSSGNLTATTFTGALTGNATTSTRFSTAASATPASATASCTTGAVQFDASYIYVCHATNTWKRAPVATW